MPVSGLDAGKKITAVQFNELVSLYNAFWQDSGTYTFAANHGDLATRKGWGQALVDISGSTSVAQYSTITAEHTNYLISQVNAGLWHTADVISGLQIHRNPSASITANFYNSLETLYNTTLENNKLLCHSAGKSLTTAQASVTNPSSSTWTADLSCENLFRFSNYNQARYFFNSGGELLIDMSSSDGGTNQPSSVWTFFFADMGVVRIGAVATTNDGDDADEPFISLGGAKGFYNIPTNGSYQMVYDVAADDRDGGNGFAGMPAYFSDYGQRRFRLHLKAEDKSPIFEITVKIELIEDTEGSVTDNSPVDVPIDATIVAELGYALPLDTPTPGHSSFHEKFSPKAGVDFQFLQREAPSIIADVTWTESDITP